MTTPVSLRPTDHAPDRGPAATAADPEFAAIRTATQQHTLLLIACGTGVNSTILDSQVANFGFWEAGKLPMNAWLGGDPSYPIVLNRYAGLKRTAIRISESLSLANVERLSLEQYAALLTDTGRLHAAAQRNVKGSLWPAADLAFVLGESVSALAILSDKVLANRLADKVVPSIAACLTRCAEFLLDSVLTTKHFHPRVDAFLIGGHLNAESRLLIEEGLQARAKCYGIQLERIVPDLLCYAIHDDPSQLRTHAGPIRTAQEFAGEWSELRQKFRLTAVGSQSKPQAADDDYVPLVPALGLLNRVRGSSEITIDLGASTWKLPVLADWPYSADWVRLASNSAHALVASAAMLGLNPVDIDYGFNRPDRIFNLALHHSGSKSLAYQFTASYCNGGFWALGLYRATYDEQVLAAPAAPVSRPFASRLSERLAEATKPRLIGVDIGRTKVRAVVFDWDDTIGCYRSVLDKDFPPPKGVGVAGIVQAIQTDLKSEVGGPGTCLGVSWPGAVSPSGEISGFSGLLADASTPPDGVWNTTPELLRTLQFREQVRTAFPSCRTLTLNDLAAWGIGATAIASPAFVGGSSLSVLQPKHLAPLGAAIAAWLWGD